MNNFSTYQDSAVTKTATYSSFYAQVFGWMTLGLVITGVVAFFIDLIVRNNPATLGVVAILTIPAIIIQLVLVLVLSFLAQKLNTFVAGTLFLVYSLVTGLTVGLIITQYALGAVAFAFGISALLFAGLALYGATTKRDLTGIGTLAIIGLFGVIIVSFLNLILFLFNSPLANGISMLLSYVIVGIFIIMIAVDAQKLKQLKMTAEQQGHGFSNLAVVGALQLYLDFINLFINILRIIGGNSRR